MKKTVIIVVLIIVAAIAVYALGFSSKTESPAPSESTQTQTENTQASDTTEPVDEAESLEKITIVYTDNGFAEDDYSIAAGGTVVIQNDSTEVLEFSSDNHPSHTNNTELNTDALQPGETTQISPQKTGEWGFHNHLLSVHSGVLTVR